MFRMNRDIDLLAHDDMDFLYDVSLESNVMYQVIKISDTEVLLDLDDELRVWVNKSYGEFVNN